ncbi:MAG: PhzF family phenazine biosynthesis isomerase, partial [Pseudomonadota bacterium]
MTFEVDWVDAFSDRAFGGNGCAVVHGGASLDDATCMAFVRETSLVECTFTGPSQVADIRVRYFLASREIPFAGHPTVATVAAMRQRGMIGDGALTLETGAGIVPVEVHGTRIRMTQVAPQFGARPDAALVAAVGGLEAADIIHPPRVVSTGLPFCITVLR